MAIARQLAVWTQSAVIDEVAKQRYGKKQTQRKKSEKRQRTERVTVRLLPSEQAVLGKAARNAGISIAALIRTYALDTATRDKESQ